MGIAIRYSASFELANPKGNNRGSIRAIITHAKQRLRFPIGHDRIEVDKWDSKAQRVKGHTRKAKDANERIEEIRSTVDMWFEQDTPGQLSELQFTLTGKYPKSATLDSSGTPVAPGKGIEALFSAYISDKTKPGKRVISIATVKGFETVQKALVQFEQGTRTTLSPASFAVNTRQQAHDAKELEQSISEWFATQHVRQDKNKGTKGLNDNTRYRAMRRLSTVLKWAEEQGIAGANKLHTRFAYGKVEAYGQVALTDADITAIEALELEPQTQMWHTRNMFLLGCRTGLRVSDWHKVDPKRWKEEHQTIPTTKTGGTATVVHTDEVVAILRLYETTGLPTFLRPNKNGNINHNAKLNLWIKSLCAMAGLTRPTDKITKQNERKQVTTVPFYTLVSTHTARRTFVTRSRLSGLSDVLIAMQSGHEDLATLKTYTKATADDLAVLVKAQTKALR